MESLASRAARGALSLLLALSSLLPLAPTPARAEFRASDLKSIDVIRAEAAAYDAAVAGIGKLAAQAMDTAEQRKAVLSVVQRQAAALRHAPSRLVLIALEDPTFMKAVGKVLAEKKTAEELARAVSADPAAILKLDGAFATQKRIQELLSSNAAKLLAAGRKMEEAARKAGAAEADEAATVVRKVVAIPIALTVMVAAVAMAPYSSVALAAAVTVGAVAYAAAVFAAGGGQLLASAIVGASSAATAVVEEASDAVAAAEACLKDASERRDRCLANAASLLPGFRETAEFDCWSRFTQRAAGCALP